MESSMSTADRSTSCLHRVIRLFFATWPMLAARHASFLPRDEDTLWTRRSLRHKRRDGGLHD